MHDVAAIRAGECIALLNQKGLNVENEACLESSEMTASSDSPSTRIIVVGRGYANILNMARSFGEAGYGVEVLRVFKNPSSMKRPLLSMKPEESSKYVMRYLQCAAATDKDLIDALMAYADPAAKKLVVPVDDFVALILDGAKGLLSDHFLLPGMGAEGASLDFCMRKDVQKELARAAGLKVAAGRLVSTDDSDGLNIEGIEYPCFVKPNVSAASSKAKLARCDSSEELASLLERYARDGEGEALVEECVDIAEERSVVGVSLAGRVFSPGYIRALKTGRGQRRGVMLAGEVLPASQMGEVIDACNRLVLETGFEGVFDIDLLVACDGSIYFAELNFRPGASTYALVKAGPNLPAMFADYVLSGVEPCDSSLVECRRLSFANEKVLLEECAIGGIKPSEMKRLIRSSDITFVMNPDDPAPYEVFKRFGSKAWLLWLRGKIRASMR